MAVVSGKDGSVTFASGYTTSVTAWTLEMIAEEVETTALGDDWATYIEGLKEWTGTYDARIDDTTIVSGTTVGHDSAVALGGASATASFLFGTGGGDGFTGSIIITRVTPQVQIRQGSSNFRFTFRGSGNLQTT